MLTNPLMSRGTTKKRMILQAQVLAEDVQEREGVEYVTITCMETGVTPLLQMFDYGLRADEKIQKGKLVGKQVTLRINTIRAIFAGRPQMNGHLTVNGGK